MLRRAEDKGSGEIEDENWVIRQTAVYHKLIPSTGASATKEKSYFLMVAPSPNAELQYSQYLKHITSSNTAPSVWHIHRILIADGVRGWGDYMSSLERRLKARVS